MSKVMSVRHCALTEPFRTYLATGRTGIMKMNSKDRTHPTPALPLLLAHHERCSRNRREAIVQEDLRCSLNTDSRHGR